MKTAPHSGTSPRDWDYGTFAGLEELRQGSFEAWAWRAEATERAPAAPSARFDVCVEIGPPPRLA